jgi:6-phosphogluconolactonase
MQHHTYPDRRSLVDELAQDIGTALNKHLAAQGHASLAVSGGSTPIPLFQRLSTLCINWQQVVVSLVDERWVEASSPDSNERLVRLHLLQNHAAVARFIGLKNAATQAEAGQAACEARLHSIPRPFTVLVLGMGNDGHTASLFPCAPQLAQATDPSSHQLCMALHPQTAPHPRMSLTLAALLNSKEIILHITGEEKKAVLEKALADGPPEEMPIRCILRQQTVPVAVYWAP